MPDAASKKTPPNGRGAKVMRESPSGHFFAAHLPATSMEPSAKVRSVLAKVERALGQAETARRPVRLTILVEPGKRASRIDVETLEQPDDLDLALSEAHARGAARATEILSGPDMLGADDFARLIGMTREAVRQKLMRREILGLQGAKRGVRYPAWQVTGDGALLPGLPQLFAILGDSPWAMYRFLTQPNPAFKGKPPLDGLRAGESAPVFAAAEGQAQGDFG
jgi:hypothetical protein